VSGEVESHEIYRDEHCVAILDIFPLKPGHLLLISHHHAERFEQLPAQQAAHMSNMAQKLASTLTKAGFAEQGYNLVINNGKVANQHIPHVHMHLIPRQKGDRILVLWRYMTRFTDQLMMTRKQKKLAQLASVLREFIQ
jgi:histidine triad (HIT) family protein